MKIGVFGGSFDPIHKAHVRLARTAARKLKLDLLLLIPVFRSPFKTRRPIASDQDRLRMVRLALRGIRGLRACDLEIRRGQVSYSIDTLRALRRKYPDSELFLLVGSDSARSFREWKQSAEIARLATIVVVDRPGAPYVRIPGARRVGMRPLRISSTEIRRRVLQGRPVDNMVNPAVAAHIMGKKLYRIES